MPNDFAPDSYWQVLKERLGGMVPQAVQRGREAMSGMAQASPIDPALRAGVPPEAQAGNVDPSSPEFQQRQALAQALLMQQQRGAQQQQMPPAPPPLQAPVDPNNPNGIQF